MKPIKATKRKDGRYEAKGVDPTGRRTSFYGKSAEEASRLAAASYGIPVDNSLFSYYTNAYLPSVRHRSQNWRAQIAWAMDKHVLPVFGGAEITGLTRKDLQAHFNGLLGSMKATSVRKVLIVLSGILNLAIADEVIQKNPASTVRLPVGDPPNKRALSMEELWKLYEAASDRARPVIILGGFCGLRIGEVCGVQRNHIDASGVLEVQQQALQPKGGCTLTSTLKTPQSRRPISVTSQNAGSSDGMQSGLRRFHGE